jgi:hypothetical protein
MAQKIGGKLRPRSGKLSLRRILSQYDSEIRVDSDRLCSIVTVHPSVQNSVDNQYFLKGKNVFNDLYAFVTA